MRAFYEDNSKKAFRINPTALSGGLRFLVDVAEDDARRAANDPRPVVFCPPIATFVGKGRAREVDILEGLALSVECDHHPQGARETLERILGPATVVVRSGGWWTDPATGQQHDKLHLHWRLAAPATGEALAKLKEARDLATRVVGGDPSNKPVCHPIRWPGSWHRKSAPRLCEIDTAAPDREVKLDAAYATLVLSKNINEPKEGQDEQRDEGQKGERIAVFRDGAQIGALSNLCAHQNGPIGEGRIIDGCVTCPWHGYQYRLADGCAPPPFTEKLATYRVRITDGVVEVDPRPLPPGTPAAITLAEDRPATWRASN